MVDLTWLLSQYHSTKEDVPRIFLYKKKGESSTTFEVLYAYVKEFSFLLLNVYQSTQENDRERDKGNFQGIFVTLAWCFNGHRKPITLKFKISVSVETRWKVETTTRSFVERAV